MTHRKQKLELTWIGKENRPRLGPRVLVEDPELSYHAPQRVTENDLFDNILIPGGTCQPGAPAKALAGPLHGAEGASA